MDLVLRAGAAAGITGFEVQRRLAASARRADGRQVRLEDLRARPVTAVAAIARPEAFFEMLRAAGLQLARTVALPDHHDFAADPVGDAAADVVCTEKDAVKLWQRRPDAWAVALEIEAQAGFWPALDRLLDAKLSSAHGS